jgi:hypothetical protein
MLSPGASKRQKELARQERQREKLQRREQRKREKSDKPLDASASAGEDPDIAGIIPGPQPLPEE